MIKHLLSALLSTIIAMFVSISIATAVEETVLIEYWDRATLELTCLTILFATVAGFMASVREDDHD
jgi:hypothetical protein